jgi:hypothetical protein
VLFYFLARPAPLFDTCSSISWHALFHFQRCHAHFTPLKFVFGCCVLLFLNGLRMWWVMRSVICDVCVHVQATQALNGRVGAVQTSATGRVVSADGQIRLLLEGAGQSSGPAAELASFLCKRAASPAVARMLLQQVEAVDPLSWPEVDGVKWAVVTLALVATTGGDVRQMNRHGA